MSQQKQEALKINSRVRLTKDVFANHELIEAGKIVKVEDILPEGEYVVGFYPTDDCEGEAYEWAVLDADEIEEVTA